MPSISPAWFFMFVFFYQKENTELMVEPGAETYMLVYVYIPELDGYISILMSGKNIVNESKH